MTDLRDCTDPSSWEPHLDAAAEALGNGELVVLPTDTVYGIAADAFTPAAAAALLAAKGRDRDQPPPVLIADAMTMDALATDVPAHARALAERFWPGPLTLILTAQPSLMWDLGETRGTVALRVPDHACTGALLARTGPLAVSSANRTGEPPALECAGAADQLGESVSVYLDGGTTAGQVPSTIVDCTSSSPRILREGAVSVAALREVAPDIVDPADDDFADDDLADDAPAQKGGSDRSGELAPGSEADSA